MLAMPTPLVSLELRLVLLFTLLLSHVVLYLASHLPSPVAHLRTGSDPYSGACLAGQLALERAGEFRNWGRTPFAGASAHPLALAMPIHPPAFRNALHTLTVSATTSPPLGWALFFIFSSANHSDEFDLFVQRERPDLMGKYRGLDLSRNAQVTAWLDGVKIDGGVMVPYKQFHAIALLGACYELLTLMDNEVEWVQPHALIPALRRRAAEGKVLAGFIPRYRDINVYSTAYFTDEHKMVLEQATRDFNLYSWWSDIPLVLGRDVAAFLKMANYPFRRHRNFAEEFGGTYPYELWKVARGDWTMLDLSFEIGYEHCGSLETLSKDYYYERLRERFPPGPGWLNKAFCLRFPNICKDNKNVALLFHTDRETWSLELAENQDCRNTAEVTSGHRPLLCPLVMNCELPSP
jgi:hypothetical protein